MFRILKCVTLAAVMALTANAVAAQDQFTLKLASFANSDDTFGRAQTKFKEELERLTDGQVTVQIFNQNTLGSNREALELAKAGSVDFVVTGTSHATRYAPALNAPLFPYLWKDRETMFRLLDGEIGERLSDTLEDEGMEVIGWWDNGFRHVSNNAGPIIEPEDIEGLKLRSLPSSVHVAFFREVGAIPTPMDWSEVMSALRQGVIDGQENPPAVVYPYNVYEVQKYYSLTKHVNEPMMLVMSNATAETLPEHVNQAVMEAASIATEFQREINHEFNTKMMDKLRDVMQVNEVPEETLAEFRKNAQKIYGPAYEDIGEEGKAIVQRIIELSEE